MTRRAPTRPSPHLRRRRTCEPCASQVQRYDALTRDTTTQEDWRHHGCNRRLHSGSPFCWCSRQQRRRQKRAYGFMRISLDGRRHYTCFNRVNTRCVLRESHIVYVIGSICRGNWTYTGAFREFYLLLLFFFFGYSWRDISSEISSRDKNVERNDLFIAAFREMKFLRVKHVNILTNCFIKLHIREYINTRECVFN